MRVQERLAALTIRLLCVGPISAPLWDQVQVDDAKIRIIGRKSVLEVMGGAATTEGVLSFFGSGAPDRMKLRTPMSL